MKWQDWGAKGLHCHFWWLALQSLGDTFVELAMVENPRFAVEISAPEI